MPREVTNPELLALLEEDDDKAVTDPALLAALEGPQEPGATGAGTPRSGQRWLLDKAVSAIKGIPSGIQDFSQGIGVSGLKTYYGLKDLVGMGEDSDRETLKAWQDAAGESWLGGAGELTGDVAQMAIPGGVLGKAGRTASLVGDVAGSAALGAAQLPNEGESRAGNAAMWSGGAVGGHVLGKALGVPLYGMKGTPAGERMRAMGAELTPGQLKEGLLRRGEAYAEYVFPFISKSITRSQEKSRATTVASMINRAKPPTTTEVPATMAELNRMWDDAYEAAWPSADTVLDRLMNDDAAWKAVQRGFKQARKQVVVKKDRKALERLQDNVFDTLTKPGASMAEVDTVLRAQLKGRKGGESKVWDQAVRDMREALTNAMPKENRDVLRQLNSKYGDKAALDIASTQTAAVSSREGLFTPANLTSGVVRSSPSRALQEGRGNMQQEMRDWIEVVGPKLGMLPSAKRRVIQGAPAPGGMLVKAADMAAGNLPGQRARRLWRAKNPRLVRALSGGKIGAPLAKQLKEKLEEEE